MPVKIKKKQAKPWELQHNSKIQISINHLNEGKTNNDFLCHFSVATFRQKARALELKFQEKWRKYTQGEDRKRSYQIETSLNILKKGKSIGSKTNLPKKASNNADLPAFFGPKT